MAEAGVDPMEVERLTGDRRGWKTKVGERVQHLKLWEAQKGHGHRWRQGEERVERSHRTEVGLVCGYERCGKRCKTKGGRGLAIHQKRMHREMEGRVKFGCGVCGKDIATEQGVREGSVWELTWVSRGNYARHLRSCGGGQGGGGGWGRTKACEMCGVVLTTRNMARHVDRFHRIWDPGGGPRP